MLTAIVFASCFLVPAAQWTEKSIAKTGGYLHKQSVPYWTDKPIGQRSKFPRYMPPNGWEYNTKAGPVKGKINVHLIPHTHDDTGWQVTVDQYFYRNVYYIIDTVLARLLENPDRKFIYVEVGFFARWWGEQPERKRDQARRVVANGQLEFINGGWCMHDEAAPDYTALIDQTTRGHQFLVKNFGKTAIPRGTWQIDPFGHSNTQAYLLGAESGFESLFWGRTDYQDLNARKNVSATGKGFEWIWEGSQSLGSSAQIFAGELYGGGNGGYGTWIGYDGDNPQVQDDPTQHDYNVDKVVDQIVMSALEQASKTQTEHQAWACGSDFNYQNADHWYHNLDKLIHYVNQNGTVNVFYSTPSLYVDEKKKAGITWEKRYDDIFPLADNSHNYWSGYFSSRVALKRQVRFATNFINTARQLGMASGITADEVDHPTTRPSPPVGKSWTDSLEGMIGVTTHHDAMSGTSRQDVADDYEERMAESSAEIEVGIGKSLQKLMAAEIPGQGPAEFFHCNCNDEGARNCLNISMCVYTSTHDSFKVVAWNPLGYDPYGGLESPGLESPLPGIPQSLRIPVKGPNWSVKYAGSGQPVPVQVIPIDTRTLEVPLLYINHYGLSKAEVEAKEKEYSNNATHILVFNTKLPLMGYATFLVQKKETDETTNVRLEDIPQNSPPFSVENGVYQITFDPSTGMSTTLTNLRSKLTTSFEISWGWYNSSVGGCTDMDRYGTSQTRAESRNSSGNATNFSDSPACSGQSSGAYIFRPNSSKVFFPGPQEIPKLQVVRGPLVIEVHQTFSDWATHVVRLVRGSPRIEVEWTAGPIPIDTPWLPASQQGNQRLDRWGKEVILKYKSGLASKGTFFTDANGREMVKRQYNARGASYPKLVVNEPVAGNYYPVNTLIAIQDEEKDAELVVLTDVSQGGSSLAAGEIELMVHRRIQQDDNRGVQEPLNETMCGCNDINAVPGQMGAHGHEGDGGCLCAGLTVRGRHWLIFDHVQEAHAERRTQQEELSFPPTLAFTSASMTSKQPVFSALQKALPKNVRLMTVTDNYADFNEGQSLLRLAHMYSIGEHPELSKPATVSLAEVFGKGRLKIKTAQAMSLTGNQPQEQMDAKKFAWKTKDLEGGKVTAQIEANGKPFEKRFPFDPTDPKLSVTLRPMEIRTFFVTFEPDTEEIVI